MKARVIVGTIRNSDGALIIDCPVPKAKRKSLGIPKTVKHDDCGKCQWNREICLDYTKCLYMDD